MNKIMRGIKKRHPPNECEMQKICLQVIQAAVWCTVRTDAVSRQRISLEECGESTVWGTQYFGHTDLPLASHLRFKRIGAGRQGVWFHIRKCARKPFVLFLFQHILGLKQARIYVATFEENSHSILWTHKWDNCKILNGRESALILVVFVKKKKVFSHHFLISRAVFIVML